MRIVSTAIQPAWATAGRSATTDGYSLEMTAKEIGALHAAAPAIVPETPIAITFLPSETMDARIAAAVAVRSLGFEPMPHLSARRIGSHDELAAMVARSTAEAGVRRVFLVAGDPAVPVGPFADTMSLLRTGLFERHGITAVGIAGHPDGHPTWTTARCGTHSPKSAARSPIAAWPR
jgi:methylenetetrahydrofolate reductase (NADPH)